MNCCCSLNSLCNPLYLHTVSFFIHIWHHDLLLSHGLVSSRATQTVGNTGFEGIVFVHRCRAGTAQISLDTYWNGNYRWNKHMAWQASQDPQKQIYNCHWNHVLSPSPQSSSAAGKFGEDSRMDSERFGMRRRHRHQWQLIFSALHVLLWHATSEEHRSHVHFSVQRHQDYPAFTYFTSLSSFAGLRLKHVEAFFK